MGLSQGHCLSGSRTADRCGGTLRAVGRLLVAAVLVCGVATPGIGAENLLWKTHYTQARELAIETGKFLCLVFEESAADREKWDALREDPQLSKLAERHVIATIPRQATIKVQGEPVVLLEHAAFREMRGKSGVAILDYTDPKSEHYGRVVSVYPRHPVPKSHFREMLRLPSGSLSQRTLILAVRLHHEGPQSTRGKFDPILATEAEQHSHYQARITNQGHHHFGSRFQRITGRLSGGLMVQEVVAESWPGQGLFEAALECVSSWRQSSGHWSAVRARHPVFGYDMKRGRNGVWYATGLFARP